MRYQRSTMTGTALAEWLEEAKKVLDMVEWYGLDLNAFEKLLLKMLKI